MSNQSLHQIIDTRVLDRTHKLNPYSESTGWIFDFKQVVLDPDVLTELTEELYARIAHLDNFQLAGLETTAIPLLTSLALYAQKQGKQVNSFYLKKAGFAPSPYDLVVGTLTDAPIVIVDDLINSGGTIMRQVDLLEQIGRTVHTVLAIVIFKPYAQYPEIINRNIRIEALFPISEFALPEINQLELKAHEYQPLPLDRIPNWRKTLPASQTLLSTNLDSASHSMSFATSKGERYGIHLETGELRFADVSGTSQQRFLGHTDAQYYYISEDRKLMQASIEADTPNVVMQTAVEAAALLPEHDGVVILAKSESGPRLFVQATDQTVRWTQTVSPEVTLCFQDSHLIVLENESLGLLIGYATQTGEQLWEYEYRQTADETITSPLSHHTDESVLGFGTSHGAVHIVDARTGKARHMFSTDYPSTTVKSPVYSEVLFIGHQIVWAGWDKAIRSHNLYNGKRNWQMTIASKPIRAFVSDENMVLFVSRTGKVMKLSAVYPHPIYELDLGIKLNPDHLHYNESSQSLIIAPTPQSIESLLI